MVSPFYIFAIGVQVAVYGFAAYLLIRFLLYFRKANKVKIVPKSYAWAKLVMDPSGPNRIYEEDVHRFIKKEKEKQTLDQKARAKFKF